MENNIAFKKTLNNIYIVSFIATNIFTLCLVGCGFTEELNVSKEIHLLLNKAEKIDYSASNLNAKKSFSEIVNKISSYEQDALYALKKEIEFSSGSDKELRRYIIFSSLSHIENKEAENIFIKNVNDNSARIRATIAFSLGDYNSKEASNALIQLASKDISVDVRAVAIFSLGRQNRYGVVDFLKTQLNDTNSRIRKAAQEALDEMHGGKGGVS